MRVLIGIACALCATACSVTPPYCVPENAANAEVVYVVSHGWHVEIGLLADQISGPLSTYKNVFGSARAIMFGYGKRTFLTAPPDDLSEYLLGPLPGPAAIQVTGLTVAPDEAYNPGETIELLLPAGGAAALSNFIWNDLQKNATGGPKLIGPGNYPGSLFYSAQSGYHLLHTCNTWAVDALSAAGLHISSFAVAFSGQAMARVEEELVRQCTGSTSAEVD